MSKIIFKKIKKHHWHAFWHEKLFEKHLQPHCQTRSKSGRIKENTNFLPTSIQHYKISLKDVLVY
jgi:hypothetical protein